MAKVKLETKLKTKGKKSQQGKSKKTGNLGVGDAYAEAVGGLVDSADDVKGSKQGFLGVEDRLINPKECVDREMLHGKSKKTKKN